MLKRRKHFTAHRRRRLYGRPMLTSLMHCRPRLQHWRIGRFRRRRSLLTAQADYLIKLLKLFCDERIKPFISSPALAYHAAADFAKLAATFTADSFSRRVTRAARHADAGAAGGRAMAAMGPHAHIATTRAARHGRAGFRRFSALPLRITAGRSRTLYRHSSTWPRPGDTLIAAATGNAARSHDSSPAQPCSLSHASASAISPAPGSSLRWLVACRATSRRSLPPCRRAHAPSSRHRPPRSLTAAALLARRRSKAITRRCRVAALDDASGAR